jgi:hypothetical protein
MIVTIVYLLKRIYIAPGFFALTPKKNSGTKSIALTPGVDTPRRDIVALTPGVTSDTGYDCML